MIKWERKNWVDVQIRAKTEKAAGVALLPAAYLPRKSQGGAGRDVCAPDL